MWVLIAVFITANNYGGSSGVAFQEFKSKEACVAAAKVALSLNKKVSTATPLQMQCVPM